VYVSVSKYVRVCVYVCACVFRCICMWPSAQLCCSWWSWMSMSACVWGCMCVWVCVSVGVCVCASMCMCVCLTVHVYLRKETSNLRHPMHLRHPVHDGVDAYDTISIGWGIYIECPKLQVSFRRRATHYWAVSREMTYKDTSSASLPPCVHRTTTSNEQTAPVFAAFFLQKSHYSLCSFAESDL